LKIFLKRFSFFPTHACQAAYMYMCLTPWVFNNSLFENFI